GEGRPQGHRAEPVHPTRISGDDAWPNVRQGVRLKDVLPLGVVGESASAARTYEYQRECDDERNADPLASPQHTTKRSAQHPPTSQHTGPQPRDSTARWTILDRKGS